MKTLRANRRTKSTNIMTRSSSRISYDPHPGNHYHKETEITLINGQNSSDLFVFNDVQGQIPHHDLFLQLRYDYFFNDSSQPEPTATRYPQLPRRNIISSECKFWIGGGPTALTGVPLSLAGWLTEGVFHLVFNIMHDRRTLR